MGKQGGLRISLFLGKKSDHKERKEAKNSLHFFFF